MIAWERKSFEEAVAAGRDPGTMGSDELWSDHVVEVAPDGRGGGEVVWRWSFWDHLVQDFDPARPGYGAVAEHPSRLDVNAVGRAGMGADWIHCNSIACELRAQRPLLSVPRD
jgi:hypothetical protein